MGRISVILLWGACLLPLACSQEDCQEMLKQDDQELLARVDSLMSQKEYIEAGDFHRNLLTLREEELALFEAAMECNFSDPTARNYWYRGRMKFPSRLEQELAHRQNSPPK